MERFNVFQAAMLLLFAVCVTGRYYGGQDNVLVDNKCKCVKMTSRFVPSKDDPSEEILVRDIKITIPTQARMNISDPTSPIRTNFHYDFTKLCRKFDPVEIEIGGVTILAAQADCSKPEDNTCYTYDRNKCYTTKVPFNYNGETMMRDVPINSESCYEQIQ